MGKFRSKMSKRSSKKNFKRGQRTKGVNTNPSTISRGGMRF